MKQWSAQTESLVLALFVRLADLFGELAKAKGLVIESEKGGYTREFKLWCTKLNDLNIEEVTRGIENLEKRIEEAYRENIKSYPPSYSEFRGLCFCGRNLSKYRSWKGLPKSVMSNEERKAKMAELRKNLGI